ncbi:phosphoglycerate kinase [Neolewinella lacunae]|uniref:Phosphoglycerate kinase n=1 Tax=Neolewinella lacunae TaxID=1517758 RepID=A0A923T8C0_9BACT|nr:phosphoglycerate kinase [Neolewinella lacunae]MBC6995455.1 phosphoglycerate kinase [Neolewinella lacunae]MDN3635043.1 phosphoglycerate kinase [Neolewinella lacunae]
MGLKDLNVSGKKVLVRVDFNVPLDADKKVTDDTRIAKAAPTIKYLLEQGAAVILMSHLGRPLKELKADGSIDKDAFSLAPIIPTLEDYVGCQVSFVEDTIGEAAKAAVAALEPGQILLLENTRYYKGEEKGDQDLAKGMAELADVYVNDAFGAAHREHASTATVARFFDAHERAFGFLMEAELEGAERLLNNPERPVTAIVGGAKVSDKILLLEKLLDFADNIIIGGAMAYTFSLAQGGKVGKSLVERDKTDTALELLKKAEAKGTKIHLPVDTVVGKDFSNETPRDTVAAGTIGDEWEGLDIGPESVERFSAVIAQSKSILWNGPMGVFEMPNFAIGTNAIAKAVAKATKDNGAYSLIGGGDSVSAINQAGLADEVSFVSTGGGAMLELLEGKELPGIAAIR